MAVLSVDLGTSNTVAVLSAHGRPPRVVEVDGSATMPSALFAADDGNLVVGRDAERRARLDPARFEPNPKRRVDEGTLLLGDVVVPVTEALAAVLRRVAEETSRQLGGAKPDEVRLTHPAQWGPVRRNVLLAAARLAGMGSSLVLVPEPVAAAAHFASFPGQQLGPGQALAVYDLGAGTFDVADRGRHPERLRRPRRGRAARPRRPRRRPGAARARRPAGVDPRPEPLAAHPAAGVDGRPPRPPRHGRGREGRQGGAVPAPADRGAAAGAVRGRPGHPHRAGGADPAEPAAQRRAARRHDPRRPA